MIVLDLYAEVKPVWINSDQFYGVPYIWKVLFFFLSTPSITVLIFSFIMKLV